MLSKEKRFIFIHNFKTGGTSIEKKLGHFDTLAIDVQDHRTIKDFELLTDRKRYLRNAVYLIKRGKISRSFAYLKKTINPPLSGQDYDAYYKFTFVRNTWARMYSWYANVMKDPAMRDSYGIVETDYSFEQFLKEKIDHKTFSQLNFITDSKGNIPMDFIGRFENLEEDFAIVAKKLEIKDDQLPKLLVRKYGHYTENYTEDTKQLVYKLYRDEIDYFKFEYGD